MWTLKHPKHSDHLIAGAVRTSYAQLGSQGGTISATNSQNLNYYNRWDVLVENNGAHSHAASIQGNLYDPEIFGPVGHPHHAALRGYLENRFRVIYMESLHRISHAMINARVPMQQRQMFEPNLVMNIEKILHATGVCVFHTQRRPAIDHVKYLQYLPRYGLNYREATSFDQVQVPLLRDFIMRTVAENTAANGRAMGPSRVWYVFFRI